MKPEEIWFGREDEVVKIASFPVSGVASLTYKMKEREAIQVLLGALTAVTPQPLFFLLFDGKIISGRLMNPGM
ncbi:MAG: hypothetical protein CMP27_01780 [Roseibacillus sp.]|nr:hypothetical protein [Roseibacillus sp.]